MMDKHGEWKLIPAFDVCYAYNAGSIWVSRQSLTVNGKRDNFTSADLLEVAQQMNIEKADHTLSEIKQTISQWSKYANQAEVRKDLKREIVSTLLNL